MEKIILGWKEWCALPQLNLHAIKAKIDTGATTSCLHAFNIELAENFGKKIVKFDIHPVQNRKDIIKHCTAPLIDVRTIIDSGGRKEERYIIKTPVVIAGIEKEIEISLTNRDEMTCRMLLGREALKGNFLVDSEKFFLHGKLSKQLLMKFYN